MSAPIREWPGWAQVLGARPLTQASAGAALRAAHAAGALSLPLPGAGSTHHR